MLRQLDKYDPSRDRCPANRADQPNFQVVVEKQALSSFPGVAPKLFGYRHSPTPGCQPPPSLRLTSDGAGTSTTREQVASGYGDSAYTRTDQNQAEPGTTPSSY